MKALIIAASIFAISGASIADAKDSDWSKDKFPYAKRHHKVCQDKAHRFYAFERRAKSDGKLSLAERAKMKYLEISLNRTCGGYRWKG